MFILCERNGSNYTLIETSFDKDVLIEKENNLNKNIVALSKKEWYALKAQALKFQYDNNTEDIFDTPISEIIVDNITDKYTLDELDDAEAYYDYEMLEKEYFILEVPIDNSTNLSN